MTSENSAVSDETDFDVGVFNTDFNSYIDQTMNDYEKKEQIKLDELNNRANDTNENPLSTSISDMPYKIFQAWLEIFNSLYYKNTLSGISIKENNRGFYIILSLLILVIILYLLFTIFS